MITKESIKNTMLTVSINDPRYSGFHYEDVEYPEEEDIDEKDVKQYPIQDPPVFEWESLNQNVSSDPKPYAHLESIAKENSNELLDMRPYMIEKPFTVTEKDTIEKVHLLFRQMHLRQLIVVKSGSERLIGIITR